ncbi:MAG: aminoacyltransferase [Bacilli bacterium]|nr:aminoacyltransferase [Bacilli bacterium]
MEFIELNKKQFQRLQDNFSNSNYCQTTAWGDLKNITGWKSHYVGVMKDNSVICLALLISKCLFLKKSIFYAPRGFLTTYNNYEILEFFTKEIKKYIKKYGGIVLKIDPFIEYCKRNKDGRIISSQNKSNLVNFLKNLGYHHNGFTVGYTKEIQYRWSFYLKIDKSLDDIIVDMDKRCRRSLKKAQNYPLITKEVNRQNIEEFKKIMEHTCKRHNCFDRTIEYYQKIKETFNDTAVLLIVYLDKEKYLSDFKEDKLYNKIKNRNEKLIPLSAGVFIYDKYYMHYVYGGTYKEYMPLMAQYKLQFDMIKYAKDKKLPFYDFGGISGNFVLGSKDYGVYEFKRGFGGNVIEYIGEFDFVVNRLFYSIYYVAFNIYRNLKNILVTLKK